MDLVRCSELLQASLAQDGDTVRQLQRLILVMGDEDRGLARALVDIAQPASEVFSHLVVKRAERLVQEQHPRLDRQRPRQGHALALPPGQLGWEAPLQPRKLDEVEELADTPPDFTFRGPSGPTAGTKPISDVAGHREVAEESVVLKHEPNLALLYRDAGGVLPAEEHVPPVRDLKPRDDSEQRCFARTRRAEKRQELARAHIERHPA